MNRGDWDRIQSVFVGALQQPAHLRASYLDAECAGDPGLRAELEAVLAAHQRVGGPEAAEAGPPAEPPAAAASAVYAGRRVGPYSLEARIGRGGMGEVYRAQRVDRQYTQQVAVKLVRSGLPAEEMERRFRVERQVLARLQHPNVATLLDAGVADDGCPYLVMQYVDGSPITAYADEHALPIADRLRLFTTVCRAVHFAHSNLVVHRDLKPSNILVTRPGAGQPGGQVRLLDFGIAKLLDAADMGVTAPLTGELLLLTPEHAAPEQITGGPITTATDIYALGVLLYELLTGTPPFRASLGSGWHRAVCEEEPARPSAMLKTDGPSDGAHGAETVAARRSTTPGALRQQLRGDLEHIVLMALRKDPGRRYTSAEHLAQDVERYLARRPVLARRDTLAYRCRTFVRRNRFPVAAAVALVLLLAGSTASTAHQARQRARALAQVEAERDRVRAAYGRAVMENERAAQVSTLLMSLFRDAGGAETRTDSLAVRRLLDRGAARAEEQHLEPGERARVLTVMARVHRHIGDYARAETLLQRSVALQRESPDPGATDLSESLIVLADVYTETDRAPQAEMLLREAIMLEEGRLEGDFPRLGWALSQLTLTLIRKGDYRAAEPVARRALAMRQRLADGDDGDVATAMLDLALLLRRRGAYAEAELMYRQALDVRRRLYPPASWQLAEALSSLGLVLIDRERPAEAEPLLRESLAVYREIYGGYHPSVASAANGLARALSDQGEYDEAERLFDHALQMRRSLFGSVGARVAATYHSLGVHHLRRGNLDLAEQHFAAALAARRTPSSPPHPDDALALLGIGQVLRLKGNLDAAGPPLRDALRIQRQAFGDEHPAVAATRLELGLLLRQQGNYAAAEPFLREALRVQQASFGMASARATTAARELTALLDEWRRPRDAGSAGPPTARW